MTTRWFFDAHTGRHLTYNYNTKKAPDCYAEIKRGQAYVNSERLECLELRLFLNQQAAVIGRETMQQGASYKQCLAAADRLKRLAEQTLAEAECLTIAA